MEANRDDFAPFVCDQDFSDYLGRVNTTPTSSSIISALRDTKSGTLTMVPRSTSPTTTASIIPPCEMPTILELHQRRLSTSNSKTKRRSFHPHQPRVKPKIKKRRSSARAFSVSISHTSDAFSRTATVKLMLLWYVRRNQIK